MFVTCLISGLNFYVGQQEGRNDDYELSGRERPSLM
jgi:hypothetical protein